MAQELRVAICILATPHPNLPLLLAACISDLKSIKIGRLLLYYYTPYIGATVYRCYYISVILYTSGMRLTAACISDLKSIKIGRLLLYYYILYIGAAVYRCYHIYRVCA